MTFKSLFTIALLSMALVTFTGCSKSAKKAEGEDTMSSANVTDGDMQLNADSDSGKAGSLQTVYFDYNSAKLTSTAMATLKDNAAFLSKNTIDIQIEGHCDERGGVQYNLALGEKRAGAVKKYLTGQGIAAARISTVTFGKERPLSFGHDEESWSKNRRGNFVITATNK
jgi:peptidoglycan-associated lipoprotein